MLLWIALPALAADTCSDVQRQPEALRDAIAVADLAVGALDVAGLERAVAQLRAAIPCQIDVLEPTLSAHIERVEGIYAYVQGDELSASAWFAAAQWVRPGLPLGALSGGPMLSAWDRAAPGSAPVTAPLPIPTHGALAINGTVATEYPLHLPFVLQHVEETAVYKTALRAPDGPLPGYPTDTPLPGMVLTRRPLSQAAAGSAAGAALALGSAAALRAVFVSEGTDYPSVESLIGPNRALVGIGGGLSGFAVGFAVAAHLKGEF